MGKTKGNKLDQKFRIHIHSKRRRLADPDGISAKAAIDGLAAGGIFPDDSAKFIANISFSQEVNKSEETIITITEILKEA
jgi:Holliday junction resolvase RusA-like endonuclease